MFELDSRLRADTLEVVDLPLSKVLLMNDSQYPWLIQVPRVEGAGEIIDLSPEVQQLMWQESALISQVLRTHCSPDKLNVAALGNMVPQLHIHHVARFRQDPAWPGPVWGAKPAQPYEEVQVSALLEQLKALF